MHNSTVSRLKSHWPSLIVFFLVVAGIQTAGNLVTIPQITAWYPTLNHPFWTPPNAVFGPVWTTLYVMITLSGWLLWTSLSGTFREKMQQRVSRLFAVQLVLNFLWSPLFFHYHLLEIALIDLIALVVCVAWTIRAALPVHRNAALLLVPYLLWITYAATLNAGFVYLN